MSTAPTILLVHGAWGDAGHWRHVIPLLHDGGHDVLAVQNPLTSLADDVERTSRLAAAQDGPVLLVGHSYGGSVISGAGHAPNVVGLVYVAAFAPDEGESLGSIFARRDPPPAAAIIRPDADGFLWLAHDAFHDNFCQDLGAEEAFVLAVTQKPIHGRCFEDPAGPPAWRSLPSWYQVSTGDRAIPPATERELAQRMDPRRTIELDASHASLLSQPQAIAALVDEAAGSL